MTARGVSAKAKREAFLRCLLPEPSAGEILFVCRNRPPKDTNGPGSWNATSMTSIHEAVKIAARSSREAEVYVALAGFMPKRGVDKTTGKPKDSRLKDAVVSKMCLSVDVDDKAMPGATPEEKHANALLLVRKIAEAITGESVPKAKPLVVVIVDSGMGYHAHLRVPKGAELESYESIVDGIRAFEVNARALRLFLENAAEKMWSQKVRLDHAHGVERVWRIAPAWNMKHPVDKGVLLADPKQYKAVKLIDCPMPGDDGFLDLDPSDLEFLRPFTMEASREHEAGDKDTTAPLILHEPADTVTFDIGSLPFDINDEWPMKEGDQSENDFRLLSALIEEGERDPDTLAAAVRARRIALKTEKSLAKANRPDYLQRTVRAALVSYGPEPKNVPPATQAPKKTAPPPASSSPKAPALEETSDYDFTMALPETHWITRYIRWASKRTDAAHEYHEAMALATLAVATPGLRLFLGPYPKGIGTNLYLLILGVTSISRKSTAMDLAKEGIIRDVMGECVMPDRATPEAFVEVLATRSGSASFWGMDEFGGVLNDIHHRSFMSALKEMLLTVYGGKEYRYKRRSKRAKGGGTTIDEEVIEKPNLTVAGGATPGIFRQLVSDDIEGGLLPRFGIIYPRSKPERVPMYVVRPDDEAERQRLSDWFSMIVEWDRDDDPDVSFDVEALQVVDRYSLGIEEFARENPESKAAMMHQRLPAMALKVAMLVAAGHEGATWEETKPGQAERVRATTLRVRQDHAEAAVVIVRRWQSSADLFSGSVADDPFEEKVQRVLREIKVRTQYGEVTRRDVQRKVRMSKWDLDRVEETLVDRGLLETEAKGKGRRVYTLVGKAE